MHIDDARPLLIRHKVHRDQLIGAAGIVDEDINRPPSIIERLKEVRDGTGIADICAYRERLNPTCVKKFQGLLCRRFVDLSDYDPGTFLSEAKRDRLAKSGTCSCYDRYFISVQSFHIMGLNFTQP